MKTQTIGVEIEMTGITRNQAAKVMARYFGTTAEHIGGSYDAWQVLDSTHRAWKAMSDASIRTTRKEGDRTVSASKLYSTEVVTPILRYEDIEDLQEILRLLRKAGAQVNNTCGIHIHIGAGEFTPATLRNLVNTIASKDDLIYKALKIDSRRLNYCRKTSAKLVETINRVKPETRQELANIWYAQAPGQARSAHYNSSRYHGLNLHAFFTKGTVEFRLFNSILHAGELKAYIQFCMAITHKAKNTKKALARRMETDNEKYAFRCWLLRLGLIGEEFKTCRLHMLKHLSGNAAWRHLS